MGVLERLENKNFVGLPRGIFVCKAMNHVDYFSKKIVKHNIKNLISVCLRNDIISLMNCSNEPGKYLLYYGFYNFRKDHQKIMIDFCDAFKNDANYIINNELISKRKFYLLLPRLFLALVWLIQLAFYRICLSNKIIIIRHIFLARTILRNAKKNHILQNNRFLCVYYDASFDDNILVQLFKSKGLKTATLQHGVFRKLYDSDDRLVDAAIEFSRSISNYFLTWSEMTKDYAIESGMDPKKLFILGIPRYVKYNDVILYKDIVRNKTIGVVFSIFNNENYNMGTIVSRFALEHRYHLLLRPHPLNDIQKIKGLFTNNIFSISNTSLSEFLNHCDFVVVASSSLFVDFVRNKKPFLLYADKTSKFYGILENTFSTYDEYLKAYGKGLTVSDRLYRYVVGNEIPYINYKVFFDGM